MTTLTETTLEQRVADWTQTYADTITENYRQYHVNTLTGNLSGNYPEYAREQLDEIENGTANLMFFKVKSGKKYYKIVQQQFETWEGSKYYGKYRDASVHAFVDKKNWSSVQTCGLGKTCKACKIRHENYYSTSVIT